MSQGEDTKQETVGPSVKLSIFAFLGHTAFVPFRSTIASPPKLTSRRFLFFACSVFFTPVAFRFHKTDPPPFCFGLWQSRGCTFVVGYLFVPYGNTAMLSVTHAWLWQGLVGRIQFLVTDHMPFGGSVGITQTCVPTALTVA